MIPVKAFLSSPPTGHAHDDDEETGQKIFDSDESVARGSLHTGFDLREEEYRKLGTQWDAPPSVADRVMTRPGLSDKEAQGSAPGRPERESMEVRCVVLWAPADSTAYPKRSLRNSWLSNPPSALMSTLPRTTRSWRGT